MNYVFLSICVLTVLLLPLADSAETCNWETGFGNTKNGKVSETKLGGTYKTKESCTNACLLERVKDAKYNGVTYRKTSEECWCCIDMGGRGGVGSTSKYQSKYITCPVDGNWGAWGDCTTGCSQCGKEARLCIKKRECDNPPAVNNGTSCVGIPCECIIKHTVVVCPTDIDREIKCPASEAVYISAATYGRSKKTQCGSSSVTACNSDVRNKASDLCDDLNSCVLDEKKGGFTKLRNKCSKIEDKYISVSYTCETRSTRRTVICQNTLESLECPSNERVHIKSAFFGRLNPTFCYPTTTLRMRMCYNSITSTTLAFLRDMCADEQSCSIDATFEKFGGSCFDPDNNLYLDIVYECRAKD